MDYLVECVCGHDLTRHDDAGCRGKGPECTCERSKLAALDSAIEQARIRPWAGYSRELQTEAGDDAISA